MRDYKSWKLAAGLLTLLSFCGGCGREADSLPTEQQAGQMEEQDMSVTQEESRAQERDGEVETAGEEEADVSADSVDGTFALEGVTLSILGDSISTFENWIPYGYNNFYPMSGEVTDINDTWWIRVFDDTGMKLCANASSAGSTCTGDSTDAENPQAGCSDFRITDLSDSNGVYPDMIVVFMGTNDLLSNVPLGENDGSTAVEEGLIDNFADAYSLILDKLETYYPGSRIYCCTLLQVGDYGTDTPYIPFTNGQGLTAEDYTNQIWTIAENKGVSVVDLYHCGIEIDNLQQTTSDGVHPNPEGMRYIAEAVEAAILSEYNQ